MKLKDKVALVTGGNTGIGKAIAYKLAEEGASIVINYISREDEAESLMNSILDKGGTAAIWKCDVANGEEVAKMFRFIKRSFGRIDIMVNNAGIAIPVDFLNMSEEIWDQVLNTNLKGPYLCSQQAIQMMLEGRGRGTIVNITSESGMSLLSCPPTNAHYASAKMGLLGLTRILAVNFAPHIRVNAVAPGWVDTDIKSLHDKALEEKNLRLIPMQRFGETDEIANAVSFLVSDEASYITGQTLCVNGGRVLY